MPFPSTLLSTPVGGQGPVMSLTQHQWDCVNRCNEHFNGDGLVLPVGEGKKEKAPLTEREKMFLSRDAYLRFLTSVRGDISACVEKLEKAIIWRRTHQIDDFDEWVRRMKFDSDMGKTFLCHFAPDGRPLLYMLCNRDQLPMNKRHPWLVLFCVERATELMANGQTALINIFPFTKKQGLPASVSVSRTLMSSLGNYYPEVLSRSYVLDAPWQIRTFIGLVWPMVDWSARRKIKICPSEVIFKDGEVPTERLLKDAGGKLDVPWDAESYWETLVKTCRERREDHHRRWRELGGRCGLEERLFKVVDRDPNETALDTAEVVSVSATTENTHSSEDSAFTPPSVNAYTSEHGIKQWKDNWSFHGTKSSPTGARPNMTSTSLESQYGLVQRVQENEKWLKTNPLPPSSLTPQRRCSIKRAEGDALSNSGSSSSGFSVAPQAPQRKSSLRAPHHNPHARRYNGSSWTLDSEDEEEPQPRLYPRPPPPPRSLKSFTSSSAPSAPQPPLPSPPMERARTSSLEAQPPKVTTRPLHRNGRAAATRAATEPGYPYRDEPALRLQPRRQSRDIEKERKITDLLPASDPEPDIYVPGDSDTDAEPEPITTPDNAPNGMDAFTSRVHLGDNEHGLESLSKRSSLSTVNTADSDGDHSTDYMSSMSSPPRDRWVAILPAAMGSTSHLALEARLEAELQAQLAMSGEGSNDDDATIKGSELDSVQSKYDAFSSSPTHFPPSPTHFPLPAPSHHKVKTHSVVSTKPWGKSPPKRSSPLRVPPRDSAVKGPRSPPRSPRSPARPLPGMPYLTNPAPFVPHESPPRLPQMQTDGWRSNAPTLGMQPPWATLPRNGGKMR